MAEGRISPEETETAPFQEVQRMRQPVLWLWVAVLATLSIIVPILPILVIIIGLAVIIYFMRLTTELRDSGVFVRLSPRQMSFNQIPYDEIEQCEVTTLGRLPYGSSGLFRIVAKNTYSLVGRSAVKIQRKNGDPVRIGTQRPDELAAAITERI